MRSRLRITALCLWAFAAALAPAQTADEKKGTVIYLQSLKAPGGGYTPAQTRPGDPVKAEMRATSAVVRALAKFGGKFTDADSAFVKSCFDNRTNGFAETPGGSPTVAATAFALMAAVEMNMPLDGWRGPAVKFLATESKSMDDVRIAAAACEAVKAKLPTSAAWLRAAYEQRRPDGAWSNGPAQARETAATTTMILRLGGPELTKRDAVIRAIVAGQRPDGGFSQAGQDSDLEACYRAVRALIMLKTKPAEPEKLKAFIHRCRNSDGGYGSQPNRPSSAISVYYAGSVLDWLK